MSTKMTKQEARMANLVGLHLARAEGRDGNDLAANRTNALAAYRNAPLKTDAVRLGNAQSVAQSSDISDMLQACLSQLTPMLTVDCSVVFEPEGAQDEDAARAESAAVDHVVMADNRGFLSFSEAFHDALLLRNGWLRVYVDENVSSRDIPLDGEESDVELMVLMQPKAPNETREFKDDKIVVVTTDIKFKVCSVPTENVSYEANADSTDVQMLRFLAERVYMTRSELVERGHSKAKIDALPSSGDEVNTQSRLRNKTSQVSDTGETRDQEVLVCHHAYMRVDDNGDGISELYRVLTVGDEASVALEVERVVDDRIPYATGSPFLSPHRLTGESLYDRLKETQGVKTELLRYMLDANASATYNRFLVLEDQAEMEDVLNAAPIIRVQRPDAVIQLQQQGHDVPFLEQLKYQDTVRSERGGASLDLNTSEMQIAGTTAHGVERSVSLREMLTSMMARNLAETLVRDTYKLVHHYLRTYSNEPLELKMNGEWTSVDPSQWRERTRLNVRSGLSAGQKSRKAQAMQQVIQMQISALQTGSGITDEGSMYNAMIDWAVLADIDNPDSYVVNPSSKQAQQAAADRKAQAEQMAQMQLQLQAMQAQALQQAEQIKAQASAVEQERELAYKYWSDRLDSETKEALAVAGGINELTKVQIQGEQRETRALNGAGERAASIEGND